jgi:hypothetical protein
VIQVGQRFRWPLASVVEVAELGAGARVTGSEELDVMAEPDEALGELVDDELGAPVEARGGTARYGVEMSAIRIRVPSRV